MSQNAFHSKTKVLFFHLGTFLYCTNNGAQNIICLGYNFNDKAEKRDWLFPK